eukprot:snap_masked-scaffold_21-processed-gene-4.32-mRNA-1 protein AED:1.00 eAED:1.00 QI:0/-1/0/0/-1/1/1/0/107
MKRKIIEQFRLPLRMLKVPPTNSGLTYKLRSIEEYALTADTNVLAIQEVGSKGAEYLERASFSRLNWFTTDISKNKDTERNKIIILATYFNRKMDKEAEKYLLRIEF